MESLLYFKTMDYHKQMNHATHLRNHSSDLRDVRIHPTRATGDNDHVTRQSQAVCADDAMRVPLLCTLLVVIVAAVSAAPDRSTLQTGNTDGDSQPFVEEVVVESVLQVRSPSTRQARTNTRVNLQDGTRVYEEKKN